MTLEKLQMKKGIIAMKWIFVLFALLAGALMPVQAGINLRLRGSLGDPVWAAAVSFGVGTLVLLGYLLAVRAPAPSLAMAGTAPVWSWTGGALGAFFVFATIVLAGKIGATSMMAWLLAGQLSAALVLDHYGLLSYQVHTVSWPRILGVVLLLAGAMLVNKY
ncbi:DMT family transporter [Pseudodesulfovibrio thermohalotolerans]|uniref:DMT family transporter n=1 Tax=Pseudodesulfovibrio thermohalotolerans TaxID=2880651 RepID=UPI0024411B32|nr:DMT family transporter [Pseudodesulfovibrio thermohalotolerans]WFS62762.1 DMT family transporter [Pseudodesulfovibrio thermohalotolerans]